MTPEKDPFGEEKTGAIELVIYAVVGILSTLFGGLVEAARRILRPTGRPGNDR